LVFLQKLQKDRDTLEYSYKMTFSAIKPFQYVALRLPSDQTKIEQIKPNT
jgi:hypothetical protein